MTSTTLHPALDTDGWVNTSVKVADYMLSHFFLSDYSQTTHFPGEVSSFVWILQHYQDSVTRICEITQSTLSKYFSKQFSDVDIQVTEITDAATSINISHLGVYLVFTDKDGVTFNLSRLIHYDGMKITSITEMLNHG